ncbi:MAG: glycosyltransferase family 2 protein [Actinomycetota bacterium]
MNEPLVSVITPTFNHERFIERCVGSVIEQTYPRWEVIVIDDASDDDTADRVRSFDRSDVTLISHETRWGVDRLVDTYNQALSLVRGEYVAILEGDDWWGRDRLARQIRLLDDPSVVVVYSDYWEVNPIGGVIHKGSTPICKRSYRSSPAQNLDHFSTLAGLPAASLLFRRDALEKVGGFRSDGMPLIDYPTLLAISIEGNFVRVPAPLSYWRRHQGSVSWANSKRIILGCRESFDSFVTEHSDDVARVGLDVDSLLQASSRSFDYWLKAIKYFDAKCELLCGDKLTARRKLSRVANDCDASVRHRLASVVGLAASYSSPRLFDSATRIDRVLRSVRG